MSITSEEAWDEWSHFNWDDDQDMEYAEIAFKAGYSAALGTK